MVDQIKYSTLNKNEWRIKFKERKRPLWESSDSYFLVEAELRRIEKYSVLQQQSTAHEKRVNETPEAEHIWLIRIVRGEEMQCAVLQCTKGLSSSPFFRFFLTSFKARDFSVRPRRARRLKNIFLCANFPCCQRIGIVGAEKRGEGMKAKRRSNIHSGGNALYSRTQSELRYGCRRFTKKCSAVIGSHKNATSSLKH